MAGEWDARSEVEELRADLLTLQGAQVGHEKVCTERYGNIDHKLNKGDARMQRIEASVETGFREIRTLFYAVAGAIIVILLGAVGTMVYDNLQSKPPAAETRR